MIYKTVILIILRLSIFPSVLADATCLSPTTAGGVANRAACCPSTSSQGEESVDGTIYEYKCGAYAKKFYQSPGYASSALECARQCAAQAMASDPCHAASWNPVSDQPGTGECHLYGSGFEHKTDINGDWMLLIRTDRVDQDCQEGIDQAVGAEQVACQKQLNDKDQEKTEAINNEKTACIKKINDEKAACTQQVNAAKSSCTQQVNAAKSSCTQQINAAKSSCTQQVNAAKSSCTQQANNRNSILGRRNYRVYYEQHHRNNGRAVTVAAATPHLCWEACALDSACRSAWWQKGGYCKKNYFSVSTGNLYKHGAIHTAIF